MEKYSPVSQEFHKNPSVAFMASMVTLTGLLFGVPVFAYSTFVTIRERDLVRQLYEDRMRSMEGKQDILNTQQAQMNGKMDAILLMLKDRKP